MPYSTTISTRSRPKSAANHTHSHLSSPSHILFISSPPPLLPFSPPHPTSFPHQQQQLTISFNRHGKTHPNKLAASMARVSLPYKRARPQRRHKVLEKGPSFRISSALRSTNPVGSMRVPSCLTRRSFARPQLLLRSVRGFPSIPYTPIQPPHNRTPSTTRLSSPSPFNSNSPFFPFPLIMYSSVAIVLDRPESELGRETCRTQASWR